LFAAHKKGLHNSSTLPFFACCYRAVRLLRPIMSEKPLAGKKRIYAWRFEDPAACPLLRSCFRAVLLSESYCFTNSD